MSKRQPKTNFTWRGIATEVCVSIPMGIGFQYLVDRTFANGFRIGTIVVWVPIGIVIFLLALRGRSASPAKEVSPTVDETMDVPGLPWYKAPYQWFFAPFFGSTSFMQAIDAGKSWRTACFQGFGTLALLFLLMAILIQLFPSHMEPPPTLSRRKP